MTVTYEERYREKTKMKDYKNKMKDDETIYCI